MSKPASNWREQATIPSYSKDLSKAKKLVEEAYELVGESGMRELILSLARAQLTMAVSMLYSDGWWVTRLTSALDAPQTANIGLITKIMDKLIPSVGAVKPVVEQPDQLVIQYERPEEAAGWREGGTE